jgi:EmrB/QacA subfamily drug resistance transporter
METPAFPGRTGLLPWLVGIALFMENLDATIVTTAVPVMASSLGVPPLSLKAVLTSYTLCLAVFIPISGWMADRFGTRRVFLGAIVLFTTGSLFSGLAWGLHFLVVSRVLQGIGGAMMVPVGRIALVRSYPRSEMITILNYVAIPALIGPLIGPFLGGVIVHWIHWRVIFLINIPVSVLGFALSFRIMPDFRDPAVPPFDGWGFLFLGSGIGLVSYVLEVFGEHHLATATLLVLAAAGLLFLGGYGWHARRTAAPLLSMALLRIRTFRISVLGGILTRLGVGGMPFLLPLLYQIGLGYAPWQAGLLTMPQAAAAILMRGFNRPILRRLGHRRTLILNTVLLGCTIGGFITVGAGARLWQILALGFAQGFFSSLQLTSINTLGYADLEDREVSRGGSISSAAQQLSLSFGVALASLAVASFLGGQGEQRNPASFIPAVHRSLVVLGALTLVSSALFAGLKSGDGMNVSRFEADVIEGHPGNPDSSGYPGPGPGTAP